VLIRVSIEDAKKIDIQVLAKESPLTQQISTAGPHDPFKTPFAQAQSTNLATHATPVTMYTSSAKLLKPWQLNQYEQHSSNLKKVIEPELDCFYRLLHMKMNSRLKLQSLSQ
jgi:hypothetical protein